jgi:rare lipoprotein A
MKAILPLLLLTTATFATAKTSHPTPQTQQGKASFYAGCWIGRKTASGEIYHKNDFTAAHRTLPFGTRVKVTNLKNGKEVEVKINNRGPYCKGRILDLSLCAAKQLGMLKAGVAAIKLEVLPQKT